MREATWLEPEEDFRDSNEYDRAVCEHRDGLLADATEVGAMIDDGLDPSAELVTIFRAIASATDGNAGALTEVTAAAWKLFTRFKTEAEERATTHMDGAFRDIQCDRADAARWGL